ncbi:hypothetical protein MOF32_14820 [Priestia megaterium]|uniref:hypothetical protein n=1 Tax=Priestia megaterium TaxID=1404 RepID=UPI00227E757C|nr:hypothetical protein [Priestia megaterium]MCY9024205.1 hypothetical protein [Priestia megaterium]
MNLPKDEQSGYMIWTACSTAVSFRARLHFPRRLRSCGVSSVPLFPQESSPCPPTNS